MIKLLIIERLFLVLSIRIEMLRIEQHLVDQVYLTAIYFNGGLQQFGIKQVSDAQAAPSHLVLISRTNAARGGADLYSSGSILSSRFDHAVIRQDHMGAAGDKQIAVHLHTGFAQHFDFFKESQRIEHHAIANNSAAALSQHTARDKLENEFLALDNDRVPGIVPAGVTGH